MSDNIKNNIPSDGLYFVAVLLKYKVFIIIITLIAAITSVFISLFIMSIWFAATVNFVPPQEASSKSSASGLSSMMKDFGISKMGSNSKDEYTMLVFLESRSVMDSMIKKYDIVKRYEMEDAYYVDVRNVFRDNVKIEYMEEGNYNLTIWDKDGALAAEMANDYIVITNYFAEKTHRDELNANVEYLTNRMASIDSTITAISIELGKISQTKGFFSPEEQAKAAASALAEIKAIELEYGIYYDFYNKMYGEDDPYTQNAKELLTTAKGKVDDAFAKPGFIGNFALKDVTPIAVDYLVKYAEIEALTKTKAILTTSLEKAKLDYYSNNKNFFIVDKAVTPDKKDKPKRLLVCAGGTVGGFVISLLIVLIFNGLKIASRQAKQLKDENIIENAVKNDAK
jgi:capsular polysaccharide biosynthesis protein